MKIIIQHFQFKYIEWFSKNLICLTWERDNYLCRIFVSCSFNWHLNI